MRATTPFFTYLFIRGGVGGLLFLWLRARYNKRGDRELGSTKVLEEKQPTKGS